MLGEQRLHIIWGAPPQSTDVLLITTQEGYTCRYCIDGLLDEASAL